MKTVLYKKLRKKLTGNKGFTLLEILVVLTIMGFLIAMVAPRLAGISGDAVDTVCDSNQNRMVSMMSGFWEKTNRYPSKMTNLVDEIAANTFQMPAVSDDDPENGAETLASEFNSRNHFRIHYLNDEEIKDLKNMGLITVYNLNAYDAYDDTGALNADYDNTVNDVALGAGPITRSPAMEEWTFNPDQTNPLNVIAVTMIGMGATSNLDAPVWDVAANEDDWGENDFHARMVFGFGPENSLVTSGLVSNAAHCPGGIQNADNVTYNDYNLVLPRLQSTVDRFSAAITGADADATEDGVQWNTVSYDDPGKPATGYDIDANGDNLKTRVVTIAAQENYQYATMCPEGHKFPADDAEFWGIAVDGGATMDY